MAERLNEVQAVALMRSRGLEPLEPYTNANHKWLCRCTECGREVQVAYNSIRLGTRGCRACSGYAIPPEQAAAEMESAGLHPLEPYSNARTAWRCECLTCGRVSSPTYFSVVRRGTNCAFCSGVRVDPLEAVQEMQAIGLSPLEPYPGSNEPWLCRCDTCHRESYTRLHAVRKGQVGCVYCTGWAVDPGDAVAMMLAAGVEPLLPYPGSHEPWPSKCKRCERLVSPSYRNISQGGSGCAYCSGKRVDTKKAEAMLRDGGVMPLVPFPGVDVGWDSECLGCHKAVTPRLSNVMLGRHPCKYCAGKEVDPVDAVEEMEQAGFIPLEPYPGAAEKWRCECRVCGRASTPRLVSVRWHGTGCRYCADYGIAWSKPTIVYLMTHDSLGAHKIGIAKGTRARIRSHMGRGWTLFGEMTLPTGDLAFEVEQAILSWWRDDLGFPQYLSASEMPKGGATETVAAEVVSLVETWRIARAVAHHLTSSVRGSG